MELKKLVEGCKDIFEARGAIKKIHNQEKEIIKWARESVVSISDIKKGEFLNHNNISVKRPAPTKKEIPAKFFNSIRYCKAKVNIKKNSKIRWSQIKN